jgi:hypothetical protein
VPVRVDGSASLQLVRGDFAAPLFLPRNDIGITARVLISISSQICEARSHSLSLIASRAQSTANIRRCHTILPQHLTTTLMVRLISQIFAKEKLALHFEPNGIKQ